MRGLSNVVGLSDPAGPVAARQRARCIEVPGVRRRRPVAREAVGGAFDGVVEVPGKHARRGRLAEDEVGPLRRVAGDASEPRERQRGVAEVAADPVLRAAPRAGPGAGVAGGAVPSRLAPGPGLKGRAATAY